MKAILSNLIKKFVATWKSYMDGLVDRNDKDNLIGDIVIVWVLGQITICAVFVAVIKYMPALTHGSTALSFLAAVGMFAIPVLGAVFTVVCWESGKYVYKNGKVGYKHNRRTT